MERSEPQTLAELIKTFIKNRQLHTGAMEGQATNIWKMVAGEYIASQTENVFLRNKCLNIFVNSASVKNEIIMRRQYYIKEINKMMDAEIVKTIYIR